MSARLAQQRQVSYTSTWNDEDDAWDSTSDNDEPRSTFASPTPSRPIPVTRPTSTPSRSANATRDSTNLSFSYTHVTPPSPSSYPSLSAVTTTVSASTTGPEKQGSSSPVNRKGGWTIVHKQSDNRPSTSRGRDSPAPSNTIPDLDVEGDIIIPSDELENTDDSQPFASRSKPIIKSNAEDIVNDPFKTVSGPSQLNTNVSSPVSRQVSVAANATSLARDRSIRTSRKHKIVDCLLAQDVNLADLRRIAWSGIPDDVRPVAWQLLLGYLPLASAARAAALTRKREEYASLVRLTFSRGREGLDQQIWHQIEIDVPRTRPGVRLWMELETQRSLERILYIWAIRHPASGYVQGINDLATPFFQVFMSTYIDSDPEQLDPALLPDSVVSAVEADTFWCLSRLLDGIQDNYISHQPGIHRSVKRMAELVARIDAPLVEHLRNQGVEFMQFAFRWMNCLLMREISVRNTIRMWDTYLSEGTDAFSQFHLYVCCAFLVKWSERLRKMDFQGIIMFLQSLPTQGWTDHDIQLLLSEAFVLSNTWQNAQSHFT